VSCSAAARGHVNSGHAVGEQLGCIAVGQELDDASSDNLDMAAETALVEVSPGTALVFGEVPAGFELIPFTLFSPEDRAAIGSALATSTSILNVGGQLAMGLAKTEGLVRLASPTLQALQAGARPIQSGGYYIGTLGAQNSSQFAHSVRWLPAHDVQAAANLANLGPALAMMAIQAQLNEISGLVRENLALTETVLKTVRNEQWAELAGLDQAVTKAVGEAKAVGHVTSLIWENIAGYEATIGKQRDLFRRNVESHSAELAKRQGHQERRQYIEKNGEAIVADLHSLIIAHKSWFMYQALRAGRARLSAGDDPLAAKLLDTIVESAQGEHVVVVEEMTTMLDDITRQLWILAELPGKQTIPFTGARRNAADVANMAQQLLSAVEPLSDSIRSQPAPVGIPSTLHVDETERLDQDLRILRWHLDAGEELLALATARELGAGGALSSLPKVRGLGSNGVLIAVTERRVLVGDLSDFRNHGVVDRAVPSGDIRYVRLRDDFGDGQAEVDLITKDDNLTWRFGKGSASADPVKSLAALLADRMEIPEIERDALRAALPSGVPARKELTE
jgi:hypothetical protein